MSFQMLYEKEQLQSPRVNALLTSTILDYHDSEDPRKVELVFAGLHLLDLLCRKNQDYGCSIWTIPSLAPDCSAKTAIRVRLTDKFRRLENLLSREIDLNDNPKVKESIDDTLLDIAGYCLLHLVCNNPITIHEGEGDADTAQPPFAVGQVVECVDAGVGNGVENGERYTVEAIRKAANSKVAWLVDIGNGGSVFAHRFRSISAPVDQGQPSEGSNPNACDHGYAPLTPADVEQLRSDIATARRELAEAEAKSNRNFAHAEELRTKLAKAEKETQSAIGIYQDTVLLLQQANERADKAEKQLSAATAANVTARKLINNWRAVSNVMSESEGDGAYREMYRRCAKELESALSARDAAEGKG